jgi:hypothetical protein
LRAIVVALLTAAAWLQTTSPWADPVAVRHVEGLVHGFLALRSVDGKTMASGDLIQNAQGGRVTSRLVYRFRDGSTHDETAVFTQRGHFRLLSDHLVQKGPAFSQPVDLSIHTASGQVTVRYTDDHGVEQVEAEHLELPADLANGMIVTLLKNVRRDALPPSVSYVAITPKPRLVKLAIAVGGTDSFSVGGSTRSATHYILKVDIGGIAGLIAPLVGKQPPDSHVWILRGEAPAFVRAEASFFLGGPAWRTELVSPVWERSSPTSTSR